MTLTELINSARRAQYARAKEILKKNPEMTKKEALRRAGKTSLYQEVRGSYYEGNHVEYAWVSFHPFRCYDHSGYFYENALKINVCSED